jgi:hypothetical protein
MGAKITLTGQAKDIQKLERSVSFYIVTGPATRHPPRGLKLFGQTRYHVECSQRQWRRARCDADDSSDLVVEGYLEPRRDPETGHLYIAVVAMSVQSTLAQNARKLQQLEDVLKEARETFRQAREAGASQETLEAKAAAFVKANDSVQNFVEKHPELAHRRPG